MIKEEFKHNDETKWAVREFKHRMCIDEHENMLL
jgi:hypothetical protein